MPRRRRITSATHNIIFNEDAGATSASVGYSCRKNTPFDLGHPQDGSEVGSLRNIPSPDMESYIRRRGFSLVKIPFNMIETTHPLLEDLWHDLSETLEDAALFIETRGGRGAQAVFEYKTNGAAAISYKTIFYGWVDEKGARGYEDSVECFQLMNMELNLVCEPAWRPSTTTQLANAWVLYNHDDSVLGGTHANHRNYIDLVAANILGDLDALVRLRIEFEWSVEDQTKLVRVVRRTRGTPANLAYWLEAELSNPVETNWHDTVDNSCSRIRKAWHAAGSTVGNVQFTVAAPDNDDYGRFAVYARLRANIIATTKFRISSYFAASGWVYNDWYWLPVANKWQLLYLGDIHWDPTLRSAVQISTLLLKLEYVKVDGTTVECDYVWLAPVDESMIEITVPNLLRTCGVGEFFVSSDVDTFEYTALENDAPDLLILGVRHAQLKLKPGHNNRLYFYMDSYDGTDNICEVDNAVPDTPLVMKVTLDYLPQFISPLE